MLVWIVLLIVSVVVLLIAATFFVHVWWWVPYVPTPHSVADIMISMATIGAGARVYDLGAGDARLLIAAKRAHPSIHAAGYEIAPLMWILGKIRIWTSGMHVRLLWKSFLSHNLSDADVIFLYLFPGMMSRLERKFTSELQPGTRIISQTFSLPGRTPHEVRDITLPVLGKRKIYLYVW